MIYAHATETRKHSTHSAVFSFGSYLDFAKVATKLPGMVRISQKAAETLTAGREWSDIRDPAYNGACYSRCIIKKEQTA